MMTVTEGVRNVGGVTVRLDQPGQHVDRGQDLQRAINRGAANGWPGRVLHVIAELCHELFGGKGSGMRQHRIDDGCPGGGEAVPVLHEDGFDILPGEGVNRRSARGG